MGSPSSLGRCVQLAMRSSIVRTTSSWPLLQPQRQQCGEPSLEPSLSEEETRKDAAKNYRPQVYARYTYIRATLYSHPYKSPPTNAPHGTLQL